MKTIKAPLAVITVDMDPIPPSDPHVDIEKGTTELLNLFNKYSITATFFVTASVATDFPEIVTSISKKGHEIGCHGLDHYENEGLLGLAEQNRRILLATNEIERVTGNVPVGYRAPLFRSNQNCRAALSNNGYIYDCSVVSSPLYKNFQTFPLSKPFSFKYPGYRKLIELPVSVNPFVPFPLGGAFMRSFGLRWTNVGVKMNALVNSPVTFYIHPKDVVYRSNGPAWYSYRNTTKGLQILENMLLFAQKIGIRFLKGIELAEMFAQEKI